jgi:hypothetical protein
MRSLWIVYVNVTLIYLREWTSWCRFYELFKCCSHIFEGINLHDVDYMNCSSKCYTSICWGNGLHDVDFMNCLCKCYTDIFDWGENELHDVDFLW